MSQKKSVLIVGIDPDLIDFSSPDFARFNLSAEKVWADIRGSAEQLNSMGHETDLCATDFGATAGQVLEEKLRAKPYDCVMIGAGVRVAPGCFLLFEKLINVVHANAPQAKICFNTRPGDTIEAVQRWI
jgi:hypothetical protein